MVFTILEIIDMAVMVAIIGFLFKDAFQLPRKQTDILDYYRNVRQRAHWDNFWYACALIGPSILLHELAHKFVALGYGLEATFHAACSTSNLVAGNLFHGICLIQILAVVLKLMGVGFVIFVPAFVSIIGAASPLEHAIIAFAGPVVHLVFWLGTAVIIRQPWYRKQSRQRQLFLYFFKQINMILFILNMLPIPGFDGFKVYLGLYQAFF